jgi:hypothetical protein
METLWWRSVLMELRKKDVTLVEILIDRFTGRFALQREDGEVAETGEWDDAGGSMRVIRVPIRYDANRFVQVMVEARSAEFLAARYVQVLSQIAEGDGSGCRDIARAALGIRESRGG